MLVLALTGACSTPADPAAPRTPTPVETGWPGCEAVGAFSEDRGQAPVAVGRVPAGFVPTEAVLCEGGERQNAAGDTVRVDLERTSTDLGSLLDYLAQPDGRPTQEACTLDAWGPPALFLVDADGRYVAPAIPVDGCGKPLGWYAHRGALAWETLPYTDRVVHVGEVVESAEAKRTGCSMAFKDVVDAYATSSHRRSGSFTKDPLGGRAPLLCVFEVPAADRGTDAPAGSLVTGRTLDARDRATLAAALVAAPETSPRCTDENARFASLALADRGPSVYVELDGCRRVVTDADSTPVVRASDALVSLLGG